MGDITTKMEVKVSVQMTLNKTEADQLLYFLKTACTPPYAPSPGVPQTDIVRRLAESIEQGISK